MPTWFYSNPPELPPPCLRNIAPIGRCIYCNCSEHLTTEHVVPAGMRGTVTLPRATCERCRIITHDIETHCMRMSLLHARIRHSIHQSPLERPATVPVEFTDWHDHTTTHLIPLSECPVLLVVPIYQYPGILVNIPPEETNFGVLTVLKNRNADEQFRQLLSRPNVKSVFVESGAIDTWKFARWLAKISFAFAVACLGYDKICHSPLPDIIRNGTLHFGHLIGGLNDLQLSSQEYRLESSKPSFFTIDLSDYAVSDGRIFWAVRIRLMPMLETPTYLVVVGART